VDQGSRQELARYGHWAELEFGAPVLVSSPSASRDWRFRSASVIPDA